MRALSRTLSLLAIASVVPACGLNRDDPWLTEDVITLPDAPPPIHGGTLLVLRDGTHVVVGDPDRDRLVLVDLASGETRELRLERGLELGRLVEDGAGHVHVVARRGGVIVEIDPLRMQELARRSVCEAPRGLAWDARGDQLHVACADGTLVTLGPDREIARNVWIGGDLRDVVRVGDALLVTRFRSAESVRVLDDGSVEPAHTMSVATLSSPASPELHQSYDPNTAVRLVGTGAQALLLHQRARIGAESVVRAPATTYSYSSHATTDGTVTWEDPCGNAVAHATVSVVRSDGSPALAGMPLSRGVTPVDLASSPGGRVAVAFAGDPGGRWSAGPQVVSARLGDVSTAGESMTSCLPGESRNRYPGQVVSVAFAGESLLVQTRDPSTLVVEQDGAERAVIGLGGESVRDTGHLLFHMDLGGTISCATCHPGGGDDGHVWTFEATGSIRTQSLEGVVGLPPYHREGDVPDFATLLRRLEVQMDAPSLEGDRTDALEGWLESIPETPRGAARSDALAREGEAIFAREACASCHAGTLGSDRSLHTVAGATQLTAPLAGVAARAPYLHDGRASDLDDALVRHEIVLPEAERVALVAYLQAR